MRIYHRKEFLLLPKGIIFSLLQNNCMTFDKLFIKGVTLRDYDNNPYDFYQIDLIDIDSSDWDQRLLRIEEMIQKGSSYPIECSESREGTFDDLSLYLVYEPEDLFYLSEVIKKALLVSP